MNHILIMSTSNKRSHNKTKRKHKYLKGNISRGFHSLYSSRMILRLAISLLGLFLPIFLYEVFDYHFEYVVYYYLISYFLYLVLIGWGAQYLNKIGLRRSMRISIVWGALFYFWFYLLDVMQFDNFFAHKWSILGLIGLAVASMTVHRVMYWVPLHTDFAKFTNQSNRGKQMSLLYSSTVFLTAVTPLVSGFILSRYNYNVLFLIAIIIYLSSLFPLMTIPKTRERFRWGYLQTWREFFSKERRGTVLAFMGDGAENVIRIVVWPIFIWEILNGNYLEVGAITSLVVFATIILQLVTGKLIDVKDKKKMLKYGTWLYAAGWIIKIFIASAFQIFIASTYHNLARIFIRTPFDALYYEKAADQGHFVDEFTVIHEMSLMAGRILILIVVLALVSFVGLNWTFILAALATLGMNFILHDDHIYHQRPAG